MTPDKKALHEERRKHKKWQKTKLTNDYVSPAYLDRRAKAYEGKGYPEAKWSLFCREVLKLGLRARLYEARMTVSKYVTVMNQHGKQYKVRFSNHKPIAEREAAGDCDFFVGITNFQTTTTDQALEAVKLFFGLKDGSAHSSRAS